MKFSKDGIERLKEREKIKGRVRHSPKKNNPSEKQKGLNIKVNNACISN